MGDNQRGPNGFPYIDAERFSIGQWESGDFHLKVVRSDGEILHANLKPEQFSAFKQAVDQLNEEANCTADPETN